MELLLLNGPNLCLTGTREPDIYGTKTLEGIEEECSSLCEKHGAHLTCLCTNHEGELIDALINTKVKYAGAVINPGALSHYSYALRDAIAACGMDVIEVHMSNIFAREDFRRNSVTAPACAGMIAGLGSRVYTLALEHFLED